MCNSFYYFSTSLILVLQAKPVNCTYRVMMTGIQGFTADHMLCKFAPLASPDYIKPGYKYLSQSENCFKTHFTISRMSEIFQGLYPHSNKRSFIPTLLKKPIYISTSSSLFKIFLLGHYQASVCSSGRLHNTSLAETYSIHSFAKCYHSNLPCKSVNQIYGLVPLHQILPWKRGWPRFAKHSIFLDHAAAKPSRFSTHNSVASFQLKTAPSQNILVDH